MISDASFKPHLTTIMCKAMLKEQEDIAGYEYAASVNGAYIFTRDVEHGLEDMEFRLGNIYEEIMSRASKKEKGEQHRFYMISFTWDVYGDGSLYRNVYVFMY